MGHYYSGGRRRRVGCQFPSSGENTRLSFPRIRKTNSTVGRGPGKLTRTVLTAGEHDAMIRRRAALAGIATKLATTALPGDGGHGLFEERGAEPRSRSILYFMGRTTDYPLGNPGFTSLAAANRARALTVFRRR